MKVIRIHNALLFIAKKDLVGGIRNEPKCGGRERYVWENSSRFCENLCGGGDALC